MENTTIKILDDDGNLVEHKVLFTFDCEELGKSYIAFKNEKNEQIFVATYNPEVDLNKLEPITNEDELKMINYVLNQMIED